MARYLIQNAATGETRIVGDAALPFFPGFALVDTYDDGFPSRVFYSGTEADFRYVNVTELTDPTSAASAVLRTTFGPADPVLSDFVYDAPTGNLLSYKEDGIAIVLTYNSDGTVATSKRGTAPVRAFTYTDGNLAGVA